MAKFESLNAQCFVNRKYRPIFSRVEELPELLYACHVREEFSSRHPRIMHSHKDLAEVVIIYQGTGNYMIHNHIYKVKKGDILIYNAGVVHDENPAPDSNLAFYTLAIRSLMLPGLPENTLVSTDCGVQFEAGESYEDMLSLFRMIFDNLENDAPDAERFCNDLLLALIVRILTIVDQNVRTRKQREEFETMQRLQVRESQQDASSPEAAQAKAADGVSLRAPGAGGDIFDSPDALTDRVMQYIDNNYMNPITIQEIADALYASPFYIAHKFKKETGYSPIQYLLRRRIGEAQTLLIRTDISIVDIAGIVGYDSQSYFTSQFTRYVGMPPRQYRLKYRK